MSKLKLFKAHDYSASKSPDFTAVFIHGIASSSAAYDHALEYLEKDKKINARLIAYDLLGSGKSLKSDELEYTYDEQLEALSNSLEEANVKEPIVLVGHSMGTFISTRFTAKNPGKVKHLILVSPPVYTKNDLKNPAFDKAIEVFEDAVSVKNREIIKEKAFQNSMKNIVRDMDNYDYLVNIDVPTDLIIGDLDKFIASYNLPKLCRSNRRLKVHHTPSHHGVSHEKYYVLGKLLEKENETI